MSYRFLRAMTVVLPMTAAAFGCAHTNGSSSTTTTAAPQDRPVSEKAVESLASARCDREATCDNVGVGKSYASREACMSNVRGKGQNDLTAASCPKGIDQAQLDKCLAEIKGERCGNPLDSLSRLNACRTGAICPN